ncbi:MAG: LCP family protein [Propionibacteriaceae bacterium]|jgi:LCP family protein required for cell wall assembly|nr:LCP family protein [Propionibacteriaceae bacterium]
MAEDRVSADDDYDVIDDSDDGGARGPRRSIGYRKRRWPKVVLIVVGCLVLVLGAGVGYAWWDLNNKLGDPDTSGMMNTSRPPTFSSTTSVKHPGDPYAGRAMNILVMGVDSRLGENGNYSGDGDEQGDMMRSDTTFIVHVSADRTRVDLVSIPRDVLIIIPDCVDPEGNLVYGAGWANMGFNAAFAYGALGNEIGTVESGAVCALRATEEMSNVHIDAFIVVDFAGMARVVDSLGGVDMCLVEPVESELAGNLSLPAGWNHFDGTTAMQYARARTGLGLGDGSDLTRIKRQHALILSIVDKFYSLNYFSDFPKVYNFAGSVAESVTTDLGSNIAQLAGFAFSLRDFSMSNMTFNMIPVSGAADGVHVVLVPQLDQPIWDALATDQPLPTTGQTVESPTETPSFDPTAAPVDPGADPVVPAGPCG